MPLCPAAKQSASGHLHGRADPLLHLRQASRAGRRQPKRWPSFTTRASASTVKESVLRDFRQRRALKVCSWSLFSASVLCAEWFGWFSSADHLRTPKLRQRQGGLRRYCCREGVCTELSGLSLPRTHVNYMFCFLHKWQGGATHVDIACDQELVKLALGLTSLPVNLLEFISNSCGLVFLLFTCLGSLSLIYSSLFRSWKSWWLLVVWCMSINVHWCVQYLN